MAIVASGDNTKIFLVYALCYLFDNNESTNAELKYTKKEIAQYSLHVVGLAINSLNKTVIIADLNGALIGGSNVELLTMPLTKLQSKPITTLSCYDIIERNKTKNIAEELNAERKTEGVPRKQATRIQ
jgi:hypothetical protein